VHEDADYELNRPVDPTDCDPRPRRPRLIARRNALAADLK
jgi:hypothetical protein